MLSRGEDPFGGEQEQRSPEDVMGIYQNTKSLPEDSLQEGRKFAFGGSVAEDLENKVMPSQIPGYEEMRHRILDVTRKFIQKESSFLDIGTSRGRMIRDLIASFSENSHSPSPEHIYNVSYIGIDSEEDMLDEANKAISSLGSDLQCNLDNHVRFFNHDLRNGIGEHVSPGSCSAITSIYALQFVPVEHRHRIIDQIYEALHPGGAFILAEKVLCNSLVSDDLFTSLYYEEKARHGVSRNAIINKRASLEGYLVPLHHEANVQLLTSAGFKPHNIEVFWRNLQFEAFMAIK